MADIFREVDEELQQERAAKLWSKYGGWVIAISLAVVLGVAEPGSGDPTLRLAREATARAARSAARQDPERERDGSGGERDGFSTR